MPRKERNEEQDLSHHLMSRCVTMLNLFPCDKYKEHYASLLDQ